MTKRSFLDLSTGHLTLETRRAMAVTANRSGYNITMANEFGWLCYLSEDGAGADAFGADMNDCIELAQALGCEFILFDCDGPQSDGLPYYEED